MQTKTLFFPIHTLQKIGNRTLFILLSALLVSVLLMYVYLVNKTVMNVVARERTEQDIAARSTKIGDLEFSYITLKNNITLDLAYAAGFQDTVATTFLSRSSQSPALTFNHSR